MSKPPVTPINTAISSTSTGRDRRPSSAIFIGSSGGVGFHPASSASGFSSPLPPLPVTSPLSSDSLSSVSPAFSISTSSSHSQSHSQLPSPPSTTAGSTGSAGDGDGDRDRDGVRDKDRPLRRVGTGLQKSGSSSSLEANKLGNRLSASLGLARDRVWEEEQNVEAELSEGELEGDHTARHQARNSERSETGRKTIISLDRDLNTSSKPLSGSETERERDRDRQSSRMQVRARTPDRRARSSSESNTNISVENDNDATPPASGRRTVRVGENSPRKQPTTSFSIVGTGRRSRTISLFERGRDDEADLPEPASPAPVPGPGPSTLTNRRARAPLPREFRSDRMSDYSGLDNKSIDDPQLERTSSPLSPRRVRDSRASTLRETRKNKRSYRLSLGDSRGSEHDRRSVDDTQSTSSAMYGGRRQTVRQSGSAESALARERGGEGGSRGFATSERSVVGESLRAAGLVRRSTVAGAAAHQTPIRDQNIVGDSRSTSATVGLVTMSPSRRRDRETPASRYSTVRLDADAFQPHNHVRAATSMAIYHDSAERDREDDRPLSVTASRRTLRSSLDGDRNRERDRPPSTLRFTPLSEAQISDRPGRGSSPFVSSQQQQQHSSSSSAPNTGTDHTRLLLDALQIFESHLSKPFPPSSSSAPSSTLSSTFPDLQAHATTLVQSAHTLNELLRTLTSRALESQVEAEIGDAPAQVDAGEMWRIVGAEYREGLRVSDDLVRVVTALLIVFGRVLRDVAKKNGGAPAATTSLGIERDRERGAESPDVGGSVISGGTGASSGQRSARSRHSLDGALRVRPIRRSTGMEGISLPSHPSGEGRRSVELGSPPLPLGGRRSTELGLSAARLQERENRERISGRRSMDGVGGYVSHAHSSSAETLKHERAFLDIPRPSTSLSFIRRDRERARRDPEDENEEDGEETARDTRRDRERRTTLDRLSLRRTVMPRLRDGLPTDFRFGSGSASANSSRVDLNEGVSRTQLSLLAQAQAQDSPTPAPRESLPSSSTLQPRRQLAIPPPLPSLPSESLFKEGNNNNSDNSGINIDVPLNNSAFPLPSASSSLIRSNSATGPESGAGSIRRRPKFSNTSITTIRGSISGLGSGPAPILTPSTPVPTTALSSNEVEIKGERSNLSGSTGTIANGGSVRVRSGTLSLRNLQERDRATRERLGQSSIADREREGNAPLEPRERDPERRSTDTLRKRAFSSASQSGSGEDSNLRASTSTTTHSSSSSTLSRIRTLRSRTRPRMSLDDVEFDGDAGTNTHMREASSPAVL